MRLQPKQQDHYIFFCWTISVEDIHPQRGKLPWVTFHLLQGNNMHKDQLLQNSSYILK